jgi:hypothetical protein
LRIAGLGVGYWLAITTLWYFASRAAELPGAVRAVEWATLAPVRRLVDRVVAGAVAATLGLPSAAGAMVGPGYIPVPAGDPVPVDPLESAPIPTDQPGETSEDNGESLAGWPIPPTRFDRVGEDKPVEMAPLRPTPSPPIADFEATEVVVRPGDHMWALAERRLVMLRGRSVSDAEIAPYWLEVVAANLSTIRSGDPDLVFPGEVLLLPAVDR